MVNFSPTHLIRELFTPMRTHHLLAILSNPPKTAGTRTINRVRMAQESLNYASFSIANLFGIATQQSRDISTIGVDSAPWLEARAILEAELLNASAILLAHGTGSPSGPAGLHHRNQLAWLQSYISDLGLPVYVFGDGPRHPSRWQRYTSRTYPQDTFSTAIHHSLRLQTEAHK